jgi:hypothetical protein
MALEPEPPPEPSVAVAGTVGDTGFEVSLDPFARHRSFAGSMRAGKLRSSFQSFLDSWREPIDVRADRMLDLQGFGRLPHAFLKMPRNKRPDELPDGHEDRLKNDLERQFILRNLARVVKTINRNDPLEFERKAISLKFELDYRRELGDLHRKAELLDDLGLDHVRRELAWRHRFLEVMQWERHFCKEIKDDFEGPLWRHDPDTNPIQSKAADEALSSLDDEDRGA